MLKRDTSRISGQVNSPRVSAVAVTVMRYRCVSGEVSKMGSGVDVEYWRAEGDGDAERLKGGAPDSFSPGRCSAFMLWTVKIWDDSQAVQALI
jgi:hypothetical protein